MRSYATRIAAIVLVAGAAIFALVSGRDPDYVRLRLAGPHHLTVHREAMSFVVEAPPFSLIELRVNGHRAASAEMPWNAPAVRFESVPLESGRNVVVARATLWYAASRWSHTAALVLENPASSAAVADLGGNAMRAQPLSGNPRTARTLALRIREQQVAASVVVRLPGGDGALVALERGRTSLPAFVEGIFGEPRFGSKPIAEFFDHAEPQFSAAGDEVVVQADSGYQQLGLDDLPPVAGDVEIANAIAEPAVHPVGTRAAGPAAESRRWAKDELRLDVADYRVVARDPAPQIDGTSLVWERPFADVRAPVSVSLAFAPFSSVEALRRGLNLPVFAFVPHVAARFLALFNGFYLAIPMFAYLVMVRGQHGRLATIARRLIVVAVAADVFDACISAQPDVDGEVLLIAPALRVLPPSLVNLLFVPALIGLVLTALSASVAHLASHLRSAAGLLVAEAASAVRFAALFFVAAVAAGYALGNAAHLPAVYPAVVDVSFAAALIALLVWLDWWTIPGRGLVRLAFTVATLAFAALVAAPTSLTAFGLWAAFPDQGGTAFADPLSALPLSAAFLRSLAPLCPLAFGLFLLAGVCSAPATLGLSRAAFARLALCCYAVLPGVAILVPVGFIAAWWTFDLLREPPSGTATAPNAVALDAAARERGLDALPIALVFVIVEVLVRLPAEMQTLRELQTPFVVLEAAGFLAVIIASLAIPAFAFGACSDELAGAPGMRKGLKVGLWVAACSVPAWFLRFDDLGATAAVAMATCIFYAMLGYVDRPQRVPSAGPSGAALGLRRRGDPALYSPAPPPNSIGKTI